MPVDVVLSLGIAKDDPSGRQAIGLLSASPILDPFDLDVAEMRLAAGIGVQILYAHRCLSSKIPRQLHYAGARSNLLPPSNESLIHHAADLRPVHAAQDQTVEVTGISRKVLPSH